LRQLCCAFALTAGKDGLGFVVMQFHHQKEMDLCRNRGRG
jgi:hypothetical protein